MPEPIVITCECGHVFRADALDVCPKCGRTPERPASEGQEGSPARPLGEAAADVHEYQIGDIANGHVWNGTEWLPVGPETSAAAGARSDAVGTEGAVGSPTGTTGSEAAPEGSPPGKLRQSGVRPMVITCAGCGRNYNGAELFACPGCGSTGSTTTPRPSAPADHGAIHTPQPGRLPSAPRTTVLPPTQQQLVGVAGPPRFGALRGAVTGARVVLLGLIGVVAVLVTVFGAPSVPVVSHQDEVAVALANDALNNDRAEGAPQQTVVNGWTTRDLLVIISKQLDENPQQPRDNRPTILLLLGVLALVVIGVTPARIEQT